MKPTIWHNQVSLLITDAIQTAYKKGYELGQRGDRQAGLSLLEALTRYGRHEVYCHARCDVGTLHLEPLDINEQQYRCSGRCTCGLAQVLADAGVDLRPHRERVFPRAAGETEPPCGPTGNSPGARPVRGEDEEGR